MFRSRVSLGSVFFFDIGLGYRGLREHGYIGTKMRVREDRMWGSCEGRRLDEGWDMGWAEQEG